MEFKHHWSLNFPTVHFYAPPYRKIGAYCFAAVRLSVCLHKLNMKTKHFPITPKLIWLQGSHLV